MEAAVKKPKVIISAVIKRKNGTVEDLGIICETTKEVKNNG